jgi:hypothetical protein
MLLGLVLGFLVGAGIATVATRQVEAPETAGDPADQMLSMPEADSVVGGFVASVKERLREAVRAGREASAEKQAELNRELDEAIDRAKAQET